VPGPTCLTERLAGVGRGRETEKVVLRVAAGGSAYEAPRLVRCRRRRAERRVASGAFKLTPRPRGPSRRPRGERRAFALTRFSKAAVHAEVR